MIPSRAVLVVATLFALSGCGGTSEPSEPRSENNSLSTSEAATPTPTPTPSPTPETLTVQGSLVLSSTAMLVPKLGDCIMNAEDFNSCEAKKGWSCSGQDSYGDLEQGLQVKILDDMNKVVGVGVLGAGRVAKAFKVRERAECRFPFRVADVPVSDGFYGFQAGSNEVINFARSDAGNLTLTIND